MEILFSPGEARHSCYYIILEILDSKMKLTVSRSGLDKRMYSTHCIINSPLQNVVMAANLN